MLQHIIQLHSNTDVVAPMVKKKRVTPESLTIYEGETGEFICESSVPVRWQFDYMKLPLNVIESLSHQNSRQHILKILKADINNAGVYSCMDADHSFHEEVTLKIIGKE